MSVSLPVFLFYLYLYLPISVSINFFSPFPLSISLSIPLILFAIFQCLYVYHRFPSLYLCQSLWYSLLPSSVSMSLTVFPLYISVNPSDTLCYLPVSLCLSPFPLSISLSIPLILFATFHCLYVSHRFPSLYLCQSLWYSLLPSTVSMSLTVFPLYISVNPSDTLCYLPVSLCLSPFSLSISLSISLILFATFQCLYVSHRFPSLYLCQSLWYSLLPSTVSMSLTVFPLYISVNPSDTLCYLPLSLCLSPFSLSISLSISLILFATFHCLYVSHRFPSLYLCQSLWYSLLPSSVSMSLTVFPLYISVNLSDTLCYLPLSLCLSPFSLSISLSIPLILFATFHCLYVSHRFPSLYLCQSLWYSLLPSSVSMSLTVFPLYISVNPSDTLCYLPLSLCLSPFSLSISLSIPLILFATFQCLYVSHRFPSLYLCQSLWYSLLPSSVSMSLTVSPLCISVNPSDTLCYLPLSLRPSPFPLSISLSIPLILFATFHCLYVPHRFPSLYLCQSLWYSLLPSTVSTSLTVSPLYISINPSDTLCYLPLSLCLSPFSLSIFLSIPLILFATFHCLYVSHRFLSIYLCQSLWYSLLPSTVSMSLTVFSLYLCQSLWYSLLPSTVSTSLTVSPLYISVNLSDTLCYLPVSLRLSPFPLSISLSIPLILFATFQCLYVSHRFLSIYLCQSLWYSLLPSSVSMSLTVSPLYISVNLSDTLCYLPVSLCLSPFSLSISLSIPLILFATFQCLYVSHRFPSLYLCQSLWYSLLPSSVSMSLTVSPLYISVNPSDTLCYLPLSLCLSPFPLSISLSIPLILFATFQCLYVSHRFLSLYFCQSLWYSLLPSTVSMSLTVFSLYISVNPSDTLCYLPVSLCLSPFPLSISLSISLILFATFQCLYVSHRFPSLYLCQSLWYSLLPSSVSMSLTVFPLYISVNPSDTLCYLPVSLCLSPFPLSISLSIPLILFATFHCLYVSHRFPSLYLCQSLWYSLLPSSVSTSLTVSPLYISVNPSDTLCYLPVSLRLSLSPL